MKIRMSRDPLLTQGCLEQMLNTDKLPYVLERPEMGDISAIVTLTPAQLEALRVRWHQPHKIEILEQDISGSNGSGKMYTQAEVDAIKIEAFKAGYTQAVSDDLDSRRLSNQKPGLPILDAEFEESKAGI